MHCAVRCVRPCAAMREVPVGSSAFRAWRRLITPSLGIFVLAPCELHAPDILSNGGYRGTLAFCGRPALVHVTSKSNLQKLQSFVRGAIRETVFPGRSGSLFFKGLSLESPSLLDCCGDE